MISRATARSGGRSQRPVLLRDGARHRHPRVEMTPATRCIASAVHRRRRRRSQSSGTIEADKCRIAAVAVPGGKQRGVRVRLVSASPKNTDGARARAVGGERANVAVDHRGGIIMNRRRGSIEEPAVTPVGEDRQPVLRHPLDGFLRRDPHFHEGHTRRPGVALSSTASVTGAIVASGATATPIADPVAASNPFPAPSRPSGNLRFVACSSRIRPGGIGPAGPAAAFEASIRGTGRRFVSTRWAPRRGQASKRGRPAACDVADVASEMADVETVLLPAKSVWSAHPGSVDIARRPTTVPATRRMSGLRRTMSPSALHSRHLMRAGSRQSR